MSEQKEELAGYWFYCASRSDQQERASQKHCPICIDQENARLRARVAELEKLATSTKATLEFYPHVSKWAGFLQIGEMIEKLLSTPNQEAGK